MHVPEGWKICSLSEVTKEKISYGIVQAGPHVEEGMPYIKSSDIGGKIIVSSLQKTSKEIHYKYRRSSVHPGDIVFSLRGNIGEISIVPDSLPEANLTQGTARISVAVKHDRYFIYHQLSSERVRARINKLSKGSTFKEISLEELRKVQIPIAPIQEQQKIAQILSIWDKAIEKLEALIAAKQKRKKALMQQLLTGKKRFARFDEDWKEYKLEEISQFKKGKGLSKEKLNSEGKFKCVLYGELYTKYKEVITNVISKTDDSDSVKSVFGDILIPSSTTTTGIDLANAVAILEDNVLLGGDINILRPNQKKACSEFLAYLLTHIKKHQIASRAQGITIIHLYGSVLKPIVVKLPRVEEQQKIASVLSAADAEIVTHQQQLAALKQQKKGLMQQLLTGKKRVKVDSHV